MLYSFISMQALPAKEGEGEMRVETKLIASDDHALILISLQFLHTITQSDAVMCVLTQVLIIQINSDNILILSANTTL